MSGAAASTGLVNSGRSRSCLRGAALAPSSWHLSGWHLRVTAPSTDGETEAWESLKLAPNRVPTGGCISCLQLRIPPGSDAFRPSEAPPRGALREDLAPEPDRPERAWTQGCPHGHRALDTFGGTSAASCGEPGSPPVDENQGPGQGRRSTWRRVCLGHSPGRPVRRACALEKTTGLTRRGPVSQIFLKS